MIGDTITVTKVQMSTSAGDCDIENGAGWIVRPDNSAVKVIEGAGWTSPSLTYCPPVPAPPEGPFCIVGASFTYEIKPTDVGASLNFTTDLGNTFTKAGAAGKVFFMFAADAEVPNSTDTASASPNKDVTVIAPCISVTKQCDYPEGQSCFPYGGPVNFKGVVSNTGDTLLVNVQVTDTPDGPVVSQTAIVYGKVFAPGEDPEVDLGRDWDGSLAPGEWASYTGSYLPDGTAEELCGPFSDTVTATAVASLDPLQRTISNTDPCYDPENNYASSGPRPAVTAVCDVCPPNVSIEVAKTCGPATVNFDAGSFLVYANISNPGTVDLENVVITDHITYADGTTEEVVINYGTLLAGASDTIEITVSFDDCGIITDYLTVVAEGPCDTTAEAESNLCTTEVIANPALSIDKVCTPTEVIYGTPAYNVTITVQNVGNVALQDVLISDVAAGVNQTVNLGVGESTVIEATVPIPSGNCGEVQNTATASATHRCGNPQVSDTCIIDIVGQPSLAIVKTCPDSVPSGTASFEATITVSNDGTVPLTGVEVTDSLLPAPGLVGTVDLAVGESAEFTVTIPVPPDSCDDIVNTATASATHPCGPAEASDSCTVDILCEPQICVTKEIVCMPEGADCATVPADDYADTATGVAGSAFCYRITVENCGQVPLFNVAVEDPNIDVAGKLTTTDFPVGYSETFYVSTSFPEAGTYPNTVTARGDWDDGNAETTEEPVTDTDSAEAIVVPISVECDIEVVGTIQPPVGDCEATLSESGPVQFTLTIRNTGQADLDVSIAGVPALYDCDTLDPIAVPLSVLIGVGEEYILTGCTDVTCPDGAQYAVTVQGTAVASEEVPCVYDANGDAVQTEPSTCEACVNCAQEGLFCRTTGGGTLIEGTTDDLSEGCVDVTTTLHPLSSVLGQILNKVTHGGQLGAPYAAASCPQTEAELGNPCIKGQWQHVRHYQGKGNPRDVVSAFHAGGPGKGVFDTLMCACLPCCEDPDGVHQPNGQFNGWEGKDYCNPLDHKVCGPAPRPAPANALIWSGLGQMNQANDTTGKKPSEYVVVRVYIEDRSEPGGNHPKGAVLPSDIYSFQMWRTGVLVSKKPDYSTIAKPLRLAVAQDSCNFLEALNSGALPIGSLPLATVGGVTADVNDQGPLHDGNRQIHPTTSATCP